MTTEDHAIQTLVSYCEANLGDPHLWKTPDGYPESLALGIIDSLYSTGSHYNSVLNVIRRYNERHPAGGTHGAEDLIRSITDAGGARRWAEDVVQNRKPAHTHPGALLKAEIIEQAAQLMLDLGIRTVPDLRRVVEEKSQDNPVYYGWKKLPSQSSGVTYNYLLLLAGMQSIKPDRMVLRFLADALGEDAPISTEHAVNLLERTAMHLDVEPRVLDHIVWRAASGRELTD